MKSEEQYFVTGCVIILCMMCLSVDAIRRRRQSDFIFPDEFKELEKRGEFSNQDPFGAPNQFQNPGIPKPQSFPQQSGFSQQPSGFPQQQGFPQTQGSSQQQDFPRQPGRFPQQPGFPQGTSQQRNPRPSSPSNNNSQAPSKTSTTTPMPALTTPSPAFLACMANCPTTSEYNPICGTNRQLYFNQQKFDCALNCGAQVEIWRRGSCAGLFNMMRG